MRASFDLIIFDLDGTLIEFHHDYLFEQTFRILEQFQHPPVARETLEHHFSSFEYFTFVEHQQEEFVEAFWKAFDWANFPKPQVLPNALNTLEKLSAQGFSLAIATARLTPEKMLRQELAHTGLLDIISHVASRSCQSIDWRDKRKMLLDVCLAHNVEPARAMMIGDVPADIESAKAAGIGLSIAVKSGGIRESILAAAQPDHIIEDVSDLTRFFNL